VRRRRASVLVPLIVSTTAHQRDNAAYMAAHGAAMHLPQTELTPERLAELLRSLDRAALLAMAERARGLALARGAGGRLIAWPTRWRSSEHIHFVAYARVPTKGRAARRTDA
jgi:UDP-N-acetylglucosamine:LPS N-acetylglucosamine transferase